MTTEQSVAGQTGPEQSVAQPAAAPATVGVDEDATRDMAEASTLTRGDGTTRTPPPSSVVEGENKASSPTPVEEDRAPSLAPVEAPTQECAPDRGKGPMIPVTVVGGSAEGEEAQAASDNKVEEIQRHPCDGRQHIYVWRQHGDHWAGHEEIAEVEEAERVEHATKCLVSEVKVSGRAFR